MLEEKEKPKNVFEEMLLLGLGAASLAADKVEQLVADLVGEGKMSEADAKSLVNRVVERSKEEADNVRGVVREETRKALGAMGFATKEDVKHLEIEIEKLRNKIDDFVE